jgi:hypothetical protein
LCDFCILLFLANSFNTSIEQEMLFNCQIAPKNIKLGTDSYLKLDNVKLVTDVEASDPSVSIRWRVQTCELRDQGSFTCSIRAKKTK